MSRGIKTTRKPHIHRQDGRWKINYNVFRGERMTYPGELSYTTMWVHRMNDGYANHWLLEKK